MNINIDEGFNGNYMKQAKSKIIAVDYDDTITEKRPYPEEAPLNKLAKKYLDKLHEAGFEIVLWSARLEKDYIGAYERCVSEFQMPYIKKDDAHLIHGSSGKLVARFYIDDRSYPEGKVPWKKIYKYLIKKYGKN